MWTFGMNYHGAVGLHWQQCFDAQAYYDRYIKATVER